MISLVRNILACVLCMCAVWAHPALSQTAAPQRAAPDKAQEVALFAKALQTVADNYVEAVDAGKLTDAALKAMLNSLDGHSAYMNAEEYREFDENLAGEFAGIGVVLEIADGWPRVISPTDGGPSARAGVASGWKIDTIDGKSAKGKTLQGTVRLLRGQIGTEVAVGFRDDQGKSHELTLVRDTIRLKSVYSRRLGDVGYLRITNFGARTADEFGNALAELYQEGPLTGAILDLRNNSGGFVRAAIALAGYFLEPGTVIVRQGRSLQDAAETKVVQANSLLTGVPVVVLINGGSASSAEILTGALRDNRRASILGLTSFGKGIVQGVFPLADGAQGAVTVTTVRYFTPDGQSIQKIGIAPDLAVARTSAEARAALTPNRTLSEASLANAMDNDQGLVREVPTEVEGPEPPAEGDPPTPPLFAEPVPDDAAITADFQIRRALDVLATGSVAAARESRPVKVYHAEKQVEDSASE
ncbi:S41 family peptidase [Altererythrobacter sp. FM1]|nr:S41 family peptidase [Altererythrobacter sp. FM1]